MTFLALKLFVLNIAGWLVTNWRVVLTALAAFLLFAFAIFAYRQCTKPEPAKLDHKAVIEAEQAIADRNDAKLKEILVEADVKNAQIDANVAAGRQEVLNTAAEARERYEAMSADELAAEIERRMKR